MILVDVFFPELDRTIDFQLDETIRSWDVLEEIAGMAAQSCGRTFSPEKDNVMLYSIDKRRAVDLSVSLQHNGIQSGEQLLLI